MPSHYRHYRQRRPAWGFWDYWTMGGIVVLLGVVIGSAVGAWLGFFR